MKEFSTDGWCPICEKARKFRAISTKDVPEAVFPNWFRDALRCNGCNSPPRERAVAHVLNKYRPGWRNLAIHECSPGGWAFSAKLQKQCPGYVATQYDPTFPFGEMHESGKWRNENLEDQTFDSNLFDIVLTQDVFEHLFHPGRAASEIARTLKPGGLCLMTLPTMHAFGVSKRRASEGPNGVVHHLPAQYHGNPVGERKSLVTMDWSYDIGAYLTAASGMPFVVMLIDDMSMGIRDPFNTVLVGRQAPLPDFG
jgi:SAM-dependent methyltransferase